MIRTSAASPRARRGAQQRGGLQRLRVERVLDHRGLRHARLAHRRREMRRGRDRLVAGEHRATIQPDADQQVLAHLRRQRVEVAVGAVKRLVEDEVVDLPPARDTEPPRLRDEAQHLPGSRHAIEDHQRAELQRRARCGEIVPVGDGAIDAKALDEFPLLPNPVFRALRHAELGHDEHARREHRHRRPRQRGGKGRVRRRGRRAAPSQPAGDAPQRPRDIPPHDGDGLARRRLATRPRPPARAHAAPAQAHRTGGAPPISRAARRSGAVTCQNVEL